MDHTTPEIPVGFTVIFIMFSTLLHDCPTKAKDLNSPECETEKNDFKVFLLSSQLYDR